MELTKERLEELRLKWKETDSEIERDKIKEEGLLISAYLKNSKWGSPEVEGNGYCYECNRDRARPGHYNCDNCARKVNIKPGVRTWNSIQPTLLEWSRPTNKTIDTDDNVLVDDIFGIK